jgi:NAD(P)-dependent dehydrogenase (short-subunit alcohol dehydrogenase family)
VREAFGSAICKRLAEVGASVIITYNSNTVKATALLEQM